MVICPDPSCRSVLIISPEVISHMIACVYLPAVFTDGDLRSFDILVVEAPGASESSEYESVAYLLNYLTVSGFDIQAFAHDIGVLKLCVSSAVWTFDFTVMLWSVRDSDVLATG